jgi:TonB family protein
MPSHKLTSQTFAVCACLLATIALCATAPAQATGIQIAHTSKGAYTSHSSSRPELNRPDILSTPYVPPVPAKPNPDAITAPELVYSVGPRFPAEATKGQFNGYDAVAALIDTSGNPQQVHAEKSLGPDFDINAVAAVKQYRFRPALQNGKPVPVKICVEVDFRRY